MCVSDFILLIIMLVVLYFPRMFINATESRTLVDVQS